MKYLVNLCPTKKKKHQKNQKKQQKKPQKFRQNNCHTF